MKAKRVKKGIKSTLKWAVIMISLMLVSVITLIALQTSGLSIERLQSITTKYWTLSTIIGYLVYVLISFVIVPKYIRNIVKKKDAPVIWLSKKRILTCSSIVFLVFVLVDIFTIQIPYNSIMG